MERPIRLLHIASFSGNIGDNINHMGLYAQMKRYLPWSFDITRLEMREFFRKERAWDDSLVDYINSFDLCVIGGGNYFELWVDSSPTGTSIELSPELLARARAPIVFHALGCDVGMGTTPENVRRFAAFLDAARERPESFFVSLRNDGSRTTVAKVLGAPYTEMVHGCPDCGFFYLGSDEGSPRDKRCLGVNVAGDMIQRRFGDTERYRRFVDSFARGLGSIAQSRDMDVLFFCHIFKDLQITSDIIHAMPDSIARASVEVAPYAQGFEGARRVFSEYQRCSLVVANRFHSNIFPLANGIPTIPLVNYPQIEGLYRDLGLDTPRLEVVDGEVPHMAEVLSRFLGDERATLQAMQTAALADVNREGERYFLALREWITTSLGIGKG